jgi:hypothetical protein
VFSEVRGGGLCSIVWCCVLFCLFDEIGVVQGVVRTVFLKYG